MSERLKVVLAVAAVAIPLIATIAGSAWLIASSIADVRTELKAEIGEVRTGLAVVEGKLDLLLDALDITVTVATREPESDER
ncbi:MAG: hypothetical protein OXH08_07280 [Gammaproteobacteria bacterium]|nr:hypothetical protein [Gammaproteobacteria bacterium]MDE2716314.1 hypothetical protein [Chloroflexota bacterium]